MTDTTKAQDYEHKRRQAAIASFEEFCFFQENRIAANTRDVLRKIRDARHEDAESDTARIRLTAKGITTASGPVRREYLDQVSA